MRKISDIKITKEIRKHTSATKIAESKGYPVKTYRELVEQIAKLSYLNKDYLLFYRGQSNDYLNKAGKSTFYPTIYRSNYLTQEELNYRFDKLYSASKILADLFKKNKIVGQYELRRKKYIQWSILQHYEVTETPLIDITQSIRVACSFAQLDNKQDTGYVYVFGFPYLTNRISINSEHNLINVRLLSITPPEALRPYFQEGYLVGTDDITNDYERKEELDLNTRLIAKFRIPNHYKFWENSFNKIEKNVLFPKNDKIEKICQEIKQNFYYEISSTNLGVFLKLWAEMEQTLINKAKKYIRNIHTIKNAIYILFVKEKNNANIYKTFDEIRIFRNKLVHSPTSITNSSLNNKIMLLRQLKQKVEKSS